eukprot:CAMPEP_0206144024 /NCGR_PEP_ID=MMETSP1473-20131121/22752_1 /ASSEMBLY_ACC=CAM_ASM_001109 /TAXON_ID=1461547 /ORGANISM="Stichococcus sp, Strain RCC1054" /LENGTH=98 /DNA_ID=CAMNT_0053539695 /DNA_START=868 /DNA_END=1166 /DNA_ORIENTATION=-
MVSRRACASVWSLARACRLVRAQALSAAAQASASSLSAQYLHGRPIAQQVLDRGVCHEVLQRHDERIVIRVQILRFTGSCLITVRMVRGTEGSICLDP